MKHLNLILLLSISLFLSFSQSAAQVSLTKSYTKLSISESSVQEVWQVDSRVKISGTHTGNKHTFKVKVKADNDDMARSPILIVTLPRNTKVTDIEIDTNYDRTPYQIMGAGNYEFDHVNSDSYVQFNIRNMNSEDFTVSITVKQTEDKLRKKSSAAAFIYNITPEANKGNNYAIYQFN